MPHFFVNSKEVNSNVIEITNSDTYNHVVKSLRTKVGEKLLLIDENKIQYETTVKEITKSSIIAEVLSSYKSKRELDFELHLAQSPLRSDAQSVIIEKATELGVKVVHPIFTDNCALKKDVIIKKIPKWQKIMFEASKQCERAEVPLCDDITTIDGLVKSGEYTHVIAFCERLAVKTFREFVEENNNIFCPSSNLLVIIGPEGGFSEKEFDYFRNNKIPMLTLGDLILKAETAVITALGNIIYEYNYQRKN